MSSGKPRGWSYDFVSRKRHRTDDCCGSRESMLHPEPSASPAMQMDPGFPHPTPNLPVPPVSHQVLEGSQNNSQMWGTTFWIDQLKARFQGPQFFLSNATLPGTDLRPATGKYQIPTLSADHLFPQVAPAFRVQAPSCWKNLDSSQFSIFCHCCTRFLTDWTWYSCLRSIHIYHRYPHLQSWGWSPAPRAPSWWLSKTVEPLPWRSISAQSIVRGGTGRSVYETWQEFVSRRNDCSWWNRTVVVSTCTWQVKKPFCF